MIENAKVIVLQGSREVADFILNRAMQAAEKWEPEFQEEFLKGRVVGYLDGKVVVFDMGYDAEQTRIRQREEELRKKNA